jgi:undecaprenyl-diphosphatase
VDNPNHALFLALNASAEPATPVVLLATLCAKYLVVLVPLHLGLIWFAGTRAMRAVALAAVLALVVAFAISGLIGLLIYSPRPFVLGLGHTLVEHRPSAAFPSNHALLCFTYAAVLATYGHRTLALGSAGLGLLVAWSRVYLGVHFPLDMVGAAMVAGISTSLAASGMRRWGERLIALAEGVQGRIQDRITGLRRAA